MKPLFRKIRKKFAKSKWPASAAWPLQESFSPPRMNNQLQPLLFGKLTPEIRISIYKAALGCPVRYLYICKNDLSWEVTYGHKFRTVAHFRCMDTDSPYPAWQHVCFGEESSGDNGSLHTSRTRPLTATRDKLIALLLTCRLMYVAIPTFTFVSLANHYSRYSEALEFLYTCNTFYFRGPISLPGFRESIPRLQWLSIRHIHIKTGFVAFYEIHGWPLYLSAYRTYANWSRICECLQDLPNIRSLMFDISAPENLVMRSGVDHTVAALKSVCEPLADMDARIVSFELINVPNEVRDILGPVKFTTVFKERPFRWKVDRSLRDAIEAPIPF